MNDWWIISILLGLALSASALLIYPLKTKALNSSLISLVFLVLISGAYLYWGGLAQWQEYRQKQDIQQKAQVLLKTMKSPEELIRKLRTKLEENPRSAKGL